MEDSDKVFYFLFKQFFIENKYMLMGLTLFAVLASLVQTEGISVTTANIIDNINKANSNNIWTTFYLLVCMYLTYQLLHYSFWYIEHSIASLAKPWCKYKLFEMITFINSNEYSEINFPTLLSPVNRLCTLLAQIVSDVIGYFFPNIIFLLIVCTYLVKIDAVFSGIFFIGIIIVFFIFYLTLNYLYKKNIKYEETEFTLDEQLIDILNNMDKVIFRGQTNNENKKFKDLCDKHFLACKDYYLTSSCIINIMSTILVLVFLGSFYYLITLFYSKKISSVQFITTITILTLLREKLDSVFTQIPDFYNYIGRVKINSRPLAHIGKNIELWEKMNKNTKNKKLKFDHIKFDNISYSYGKDKTVFKDKTIDVPISNNSIIGITGESGSGKSTLMKLLIKIYKLNKGNIFIDDVNINDLDPVKLRENVTYVNQNSKLFDEKVIKNILYGCINEDDCNKHLKEIFQYPTISNLYKNVNIHTKNAGQLGENLSGGQRQVANLISGLINPSDILILDEPTNALDPELKKEIINIIQHFKKYKKAIFIITHDKDVFNIFDEQIKMD
tara:strand:- start:889 stop:2562 length:1674 start_codon:yes stop_codon:yes gene_type:complete